MTPAKHKRKTHDMPVRDNPKSRQERRRQQRRQQIARQERRRQSTRRWYLIGGLALVLVLLGGGGAGAYFAFAHSDSGLSPGGAIDGISCGGSEMLNYHIHAHLTLYQNGRAVPVPAYVGIPYSSAINASGQHTCFYWLHTHDASGVVHIESPTHDLYTLGQFFDIWHYTSLWDAQGGLAGPAGLVVDSSFVNALRSAKPGEIHVCVGGKYVGSNYRSITLSVHKLITVEIGTPLKPPTTHYTFPAGE
jgi:hypothetical protein